MQGKLIMTTPKGMLIEEEIFIDVVEKCITGCETLGPIDGLLFKSLIEEKTVEIQGKQVRLTVPCPFCKSYECFEKKKGECPTVYAGKR
jgi:hypothetical protein